MFPGSLILVLTPFHDSTKKFWCMNLFKEKIIGTLTEKKKTEAKGGNNISCEHASVHQ